MDRIRHPIIHEQGSISFFSSLAMLLVFSLIMGCGNDSPQAHQVASPPGSVPSFEGTIVAVGDSLTAGLGVAEEMAYPALLANKLKAAGYHYRVINAGVSGETSSGALSRTEWIIASLKPDIVILETGANDGLRGIDPKLLEKNLDQICYRLKEHDIQVLLVGMQMLPNLGPEYTRSFSTIYPQIAQKHRVVFMPFFLENVAGVPGLNQPDRIHPSAEGYVRITDNIFPYVLQAIDRQRKGDRGR